MPLLKYVRGEMFSEKHWLEMFGILGIPSKSVELLTFADFLDVKEKIAANANALQVRMYSCYGGIAISDSLIYGFC